MNTIIWDLDGTLIDSADEILFHLKKSIDTIGTSMLFKEKDLRIGATVDIILKSAYPDLGEELLNKIIAFFRTSYDNSSFKHTVPVSGIERIFHIDHEIRHIIVTNKPRLPTDRILKKIGWTEYFADIYTPYQNGSTIKLSKEELFKNITEKYMLNYTNCIAVGDMVSDCVAANLNKLYSAGVVWGSSTEKELICKYCDIIIYTTEQLADLITTRFQLSL